jgi:hypothetical protein
VKLCTTCGEPGDFRVRLSGHQKGKLSSSCRRCESLMASRGLSAAEVRSLFGVDRRDPSRVCPRGHDLAEVGSYSYRRDNGSLRTRVCARCARETGIRRSRERRLFLDQLKAVPCADCGGEFPAVCMDFDHRDPSTKSFTISANKTVSWEKLLAEIAKCDVVCANCHRLRSAVRGGWWHGDD